MSTANVIQSAILRFWSKIRRNVDTDCWLWTGGTDKNGYGQAAFCGENIRAHRLAYLLAVGDIPQPLYVLHKCDVPGCCNPSHLFLGTNVENMADKVAKFRQPLGASVHNAKVTSEQVLEIRRLRSEGWLLRELAALYPLNISAVNHICLGRNWGHLAP